MPPINRLDHVVIAVRSLDAAAVTYRKFGFTLAPRGLHEGKGTGNHCIMFANTYVELLGIVDDGGAKSRLAERVNARGEGGMALAYGADDADKTFAALRAAGIGAEAPNDLARPLDLDGQRQMVRFRNIMLPALKLQDTMQFVCTHVTPELTRARREWQLHPNGATGLARVTIATDDPAAAAREFETLFAGRLANTEIEAAPRAEIDARLGSKTLEGAPAAGIVALTLRVNEVDAVGAMLDMGRVPHRETKAGLVVHAAAAHGVALTFAEN
jgi:catechol 2,3-dioxygenase-like lactoylglutathione lyase family enzyme